MSRFGGAPNPNLGDIIDGKAFARAVKQNNDQLGLTDLLANLARFQARCNETHAWRAAYERSYERLQKAAGDIKRDTGKDVYIPRYIPGTDALELVAVEASPNTDMSYRETGGKGPSGKGLPVPAVYGSASDTTWLEINKNGK